MTEIEQLRKEINELRERTAKLEARKERAQRVEYERFRQERDEWFRQNPMPPASPHWISPRDFPPGTIIC